MISTRLLRPKSDVYSVDRYVRPRRIISIIIIIIERRLCGLKTCSGLDLDFHPTLTYQNLNDGFFDNSILPHRYSGNIGQYLTPHKIS